MSAGSEKIASALAALLGVAIGGAITLTTTRLQLSQASRSEQRRLDVEKLEQLHVQVSDCLEKIHALWQADLQFIGPGEFSTPLHPQVLDKEEDIRKCQTKIRMLVGFYAPELKRDMQALDKTYAQLEGAMAKLDVARGYRSVPNSKAGRFETESWTVRKPVLEGGYHVLRQGRDFQTDIEAVFLSRNPELARAQLGSAKPPTAPSAGLPKSACWLRLFLMGGPALIGTGIGKIVCTDVTSTTEASESTRK